MNSAKGRKPVRAAGRGPAKVIPLPFVRRQRRRRAAVIAIGALGFAAFGSVGLWHYVVPSVHIHLDHSYGMSAEEAKILELVNAERIRLGEPALKASGRLGLASRSHSYDMAVRGYFSHDGPSGDTPAERLESLGVGYRELAENIYTERSGDLNGLPERAVAGWLHSPEHRANMLAPGFRETGIGVSRTANGSAYVTQDFVR